MRMIVVLIAVFILSSPTVAADDVATAQSVIRAGAGVQPR
jgi:hypothetical protein